jgi:hypothetical protein
MSNSVMTDAPAAAAPIVRGTAKELTPSEVKDYLSRDNWPGNSILRLASQRMGARDGDVYLHLQKNVKKEDQDYCES